MSKCELYPEDGCPINQLVDEIQSLKENLLCRCSCLFVGGEIDTEHLAKQCGYHGIENAQQVLIMASLEKEITALREQLISLCRIFHGEDCVCKWCNIVKERAGKAVKAEFNPFKPEKPFSSKDYPLNSGSTVVDKRDLRKGER
jgi:hypothetical protein